MNSGNHPFFELLKKENLEKNLRALEVSKVLGGFSSRSNLIESLTVNDDLMIDGTIFSDGSVDYIVVNGSTVISDLPNIEPYGDVYPDHWGSNTTPGTTDMRSAFQSAIDWASTNSKSVNLKPVTYGIGSSGSTYASRDYGLTIPSNTTIKGDNVLTSVIQALPNADIDMIISPPSTVTSDISFSDFTIDGNEANQTESADEGFSFWIFDASRVFFENILSLNPKSWGVRIERCENVSLEDIVCDHSAESNSDGIHFVDTSIVTVGTCNIKSAGDDGFIIETAHEDVSDYVINNLLVETQNGLSLPARGFLLIGDDGTMTGAFSISNVIANVVCRDVSGGALVISGAGYENLDITSVSDNCGNDLQFYPGNAVYSASGNNCKFNIQGSNATSAGITTLLTNGTINNCELNARIYDGPAASPAVTLYGSNWKGDISVVYDNITCTTSAVNWLADNSVMTLSVDGGTNSLLVQGAGDNNTFHLGTLQGSSLASINTAGGAVGNRFIGGRVTDTVTLGGGDELFTDVQGANIKDQIVLNFSTNADGTVTYTHGLQGTPKFAQLTPFTTTPQHIQIGALSSTTVTIQGANAAGTGYTSGSFNCFIELSL